MTTILHLSDLHFGTETRVMLEWLLDDIKEIKPDVIVISGDFTQRALRKQYKAAQEFLQHIHHPHILCVPGNHDISLHNLIERFTYPFAKYKKYITKDLSPTFCNNEIAMLGLNSATPYRAKSGILTNEQLDNACQFFITKSQPIKIVVMHHNLIHSELHKAISNTEEIIKTFSECQINLILSGHLHYACVEQLKQSSLSHNMYVITAGTAVSKRLRKGQNSYNVIHFENGSFVLTIRELLKNKFVISQELTFPL